MKVPGDADALSDGIPWELFPKSNKISLAPIKVDMMSFKN